MKLTKEQKENLEFAKKLERESIKAVNKKIMIYAAFIIPITITAALLWPAPH